MFCYDENVKGVHKRFLRAQMIKFLTLQRRDNVMVHNGHCFGYSIIYAASAVLGRLEQWQQQLQLIADWDGTAAQLDQVHSIGDRRISLLTVFDEVIAQVRFHQAVSQSLDSRGQNALLYQPGLLELHVAEDKAPLSVTSRAQTASASGHMTSAQIATLLDKVFISGLMVTISGFFVGSDGAPHPHACSVRYCEETDRYFFFDSNEKEGEVACINKAALLDILQKRLTNNISINLIDIDKRHAEQIIAFKKAYHAIMFEQGPKLVEGLGLLEFAKFSDPGEFVAVYSDLTKAQQVAWAKRRDDGISPLYLAILYNQDSLMIYQYAAERSHFNINAAIDDKFSLLSAAACSGQTGLVKAILKHPELNLESVFNQGALYYAARFGHADTLQALIDSKRFDINEYCRGFSPLQLAICYGHVDVARLLVAQSDINIDQRARRLAADQPAFHFVLDTYQSSLKPTIPVLTGCLFSSTSFMRIETCSELDSTSAIVAPAASLDS